jgi:hypothetical protein
VRLFLIIITITIALSFAGGCSHATIWSQDATGGVLALHGFEDDAMHDAHAKMTQHCGARGFQIVGRDTVVVGQRTHTTQDADYDERRDTTTGKIKPVGTGTSTHRQARAQTTTTTTTEDLTEVRVSYQCGGAAPSPSAP